MKIVLASANKGKIEEFKKLLPKSEVVAYSDILGKFDIPETGTTFKENAIIKASAINERLKEKGEKDFVVISDDSGISLPILNNAPGVYSARFAGLNASDKENNAKLISKLNELNLEKTAAFYTACIAIIYKDFTYTVHGFMHGDAINKELGKNGFGYDPLFIPKNFSKTLGELDFEVKQKFSHRSKALNLAKKVLDVIL
ncbi:non-canonical purine NTP pyrophosphatase [Aliarcobacter skirrowii]|uniref:dITP/XTP pyrophosphatase n=1 Tax=Aliarcobacter skirrowii TaxID=28200 RepID=A0A2U2BZX0_9BACT|nr:non-canonical purine NTP pyrophosphatase [Aliarcobacter skirrowii]PWE19703.1 non-canonical purine NTP pyrophosphatase [Aliarcobacter skirrowii]PWE20970.1 non-canonical purine NTP pyrophosphatase [Aliarcobacter skirrowii]PWE24780.1 non-canonical purine NTP pyrophosphatase [Aliarcobacter skirrowii]RJO55348.1 non-canonical purine NTP pyrophosphatase [Aliarcobacter skirrowii]RJO57303.1 non-canonical purine NTP pyrophosphatase [Aliarcobacter skirrowii]